MEAGLEEVARLFAVGEDFAVDGDGSRAVSRVFGEICDFQTEEIVVGKLIGKTFLDDDRLRVAGVMSKEERESGAGLDWRDDAVGGRLAEQVETFFLVAGNASDADHDSEDAWQASDGELLDPDGHLGVGVAWVNLEGLLAVVAGGQALAGSGDEAVFGKSDEGGVHAPGVASGEVGVGVVWIRLDLLIAEGDSGVGERFDAVACGRQDCDAAFGGEEGIVGIVSGVEQILMGEFAKDERHQDVAGRDGRLGIGLLDSFKTRECPVVVEVVKVIVGLTDLGGEIDGIGVVGRIAGLRVGRSCKEKREEQAQGFDTTFDDSSPRP